MTRDCCLKWWGRYGHWAGVGSGHGAGHCRSLRHGSESRSQLASRAVVGGVLYTWVSFGHQILQAYLQDRRAAKEDARQVSRNVAQFKRLFYEKGDNWRAQKVNLLIKNYIKVGTTLEINISSSVRERILQRVVRNKINQDSYDIFDEAYEQVKEIIQNGVWPWGRTCSSLHHALDWRAIIEKQSYYTSHLARVVKMGELQLGRGFPTQHGWTIAVKSVVDSLCSGM
ncbi:hypothetical protein BASA82_000597 [Batrachochytrium salamandrivorans]|nr:hypothetical protein BASA82_000597 [Batrachochytrium salamandrivorans]